MQWIQQQKPWWTKNKKVKKEIVTESKLEWEPRLKGEGFSHLTPLMYWALGPAMDRATEAMIDTENYTEWAISR